MSTPTPIWFDETHAQVGPEILHLAQAAIDWEAIDDEVHITCCVDDDLALCGADVTGQPWVDFHNGGEDDCTVCEYLDAHEDDDQCRTDCPALRLKRGLS